MISLKNITLLSKLLTILLLIQYSLQAQEQLNLNKPIQNIVIIGNKLTDENVIRRELLFSEGEIPSKEQFAESHKRLLNLFLFNRVEMYLRPHDSQNNILIIEITEQLYYYPLPILNINERDWGKISYGLSFVHYNFRGQNEKLWAGAWFGYRPGFGLNYSDQWAGDSLHLTTGLRLSKTTFDHRTLDFEEQHVTGEFTIGKWWSLYFKTDIAIRYDNIRVDELYSALMHSETNNEKLWGLNLSVRFDNRDLYSYPTNGWYTRFTFLKNGIFQQYNNYFKTTIDIRRYQKIGPTVFAARFHQNNIFGEVPVYRLNYIGFGERIRGHFYTVWEGKNVQVGNLALRFPIIPIRYITMNLPMIPVQYSTNLKLGLNAGIFVDSGIVWDNSKEYGIKNFHTGFGFGLHLLLPYVEVFRVDYGFNRDLEGQFILEVGISF
jgi:outer membrane protein assembly factor BamA